MKGIKLLLGCILLLGAASCTTHDDYFDDDISLYQLLSGYELWYVDIHNTSGNGEVPFLQKAFTISFRNGVFYANNNLVGIGKAGNGFGTDAGYYDIHDTFVVIDHDLDGVWELEVYQRNGNTIELYDRYSRTSYSLIGYQRHNFNYDKVFYENINYFLQEYEGWENTFTSRQGQENSFDRENFLRFLPDSSGDWFLSSTDRPGTGMNNIVWDYEGEYRVFNISGEPYAKILTLDYDYGGNRQFELSVIDDRMIELYHINSGTIYEFTGRRFIQYLKAESHDSEKAGDTGKKRKKIINETLNTERQSASRKIKIS